MSNGPTLDPKINSMTAIGGQKEVDAYINFIIHRRRKYGFTEPDKKWFKYAQEINEKGYCVIENFFNTSDDKKMLDQIEQEFRQFQKENKLQYKTSYTEQISHPLYKCDTIFPLAFDERIIDISKHFFQCVPALTNINFRLSKAQEDFDHPNDVLEHPEKVNEAFRKLQKHPGAETTCFHFDHDSVRFLKFFVYLTDVEIENGPFTYVEGSHIQKAPYWRETTQRRNDGEIYQEYGEKRIKHLTGKKGDLIIANTHGYHKGLHVKKGERLMLTIYYSCHPTEFKETFGGKMKQSDFENLPEDKKPLADFLNKE